MASKDAHLEDRSMLTSSFGEHRANTRQGVDDLLALSSLMSNHVHSDHFLASESRLIHSKFQRLFHFLLTDVQHEPMIQASGDAISMPEHVDDALINLNRSATLKFRNYKQFREHLLTTERREQSDPLENAPQQGTHLRSSTSSFSLHHQAWLRSRNLLRYFSHWLIQSTFFRWFISIVICLDAITVAITTEYNSPGDSKSKVYIIAVFVNRCILFIYLLELIFKWIDHFTNFWYSAVNIMEFLLTLISLINLISEIHFDTTNHSYLNQNKKFAHHPSNSTDALQRLRLYGSILSLLRTLRMLRVLRILEIAFRFTQVRIVFLALSRSVKLIFHVVLLTIILNYFFALIALYLTQFGLNTTSTEDMKKIQLLFGTVPRAFITVFRIFTKDEWYEIKLEMYALKMSPIIIDSYVISWLFFGGYVLNPLLVGAMVGTFDETRKELTEGIEKIISKTRLSLNETDLPSRNSSTSTFSLLMAQMNSIPTKQNTLERDEDKLNEWLRFTSDELRFLVQDRMETQWPLYTAFYYLQLLEIYFENIAERQLLFDFFSISLMALHDKETNSIDPPILSSSDDDD